MYPCSPHEKAMQRALIQYRDPKNYRLVHEALVLAGREDLIGFGPKCLIKPPLPAQGPALTPASRKPLRQRQAPVVGRISRQGLS